jgi:hypothetical protein
VSYESEYSLFLTHINNLMERRKSVTATFLSVNAAITGAMAFLFEGGQLQEWPQQVAAVVFLLTGIVACALWRRLLRHYSTMIGWWYDRLRELEDKLPESSKLISAEHDQLVEPANGVLKTRASTYEINLSRLFSGVYCLFIAGIVSVLLFNVVHSLFIAGIGFLLVWKFF